MSRTSIADSEQRGRSFFHQTAACTAIVLGVLIATNVTLAYPTYRSSGSENCFECHAGFDGGFSAPLHGAHAAALNNDCVACHETPGSTPVNLDSSNNGQLPGCNGCHAPVGLRLHHTNAGAPMDSIGLTCQDCHPDDPSPEPENFSPVYYGTRAPGLDPCDGSEELIASNTFSLDNDGDLLYDSADPDCAPGCGSDADCDDGEFCNGAETCDAASGECLPGGGVDCDDAVGCTIDSCDEAIDACVHVTDDGLCDNGMFCDGVETCDAVTDCQSGTPPCDSANETCNETADACLPLGCIADSECDDGTFCNGSETCNAATGECNAGTPVNCDDGDVCTADECDEATADCITVEVPENHPSCMPEGQCFDGLDDDFDGFTDCADPDCDFAQDGLCDTGEQGICAAGILTCDGGLASCIQVDAAQTETTASGNCSDGLDNDCDGATDGADAGCAPAGPNVHLTAVTDCSNCHWTNRETQETDLRPLHGFNCGLCHTSGFQGTLLGPLGTWDHQCTDCHNPFTEETGFRDEPTKGHRCVVCHGQQRGTGNTANFHKKHVEEANCVVCHGYIPEPEPSVGPRGVCAVCHGNNDDKGYRDGDDDDVHRKHVPKGLSCLECHGGIRPPVDTNQVCYLCHDDGRSDDDDTQEIHEKHADKRMDCGACHANANLQDDRVPMPPIDDVVRASVSRGGPGACETCHDGGKDGDGNDAQEIHEKHVADQWQWCFNCHLPEDPRPQGLAPPAVDAASSCVVCHDDEDFDAPTPFRIHEKHADKNKCYACHQTVPPIFDWPASWGRTGGSHDNDGDGHDNHEDCDDDDARTYPGAPEVNDNKDNQCRGDHGHLLVDEISGMSNFNMEGGSPMYDWPAQLWASSYQVARSTLADFSGPCEYMSAPGPELIDVTDPAPGQVFFYVARPMTPNGGSWGADSSGVERDHIDP